MSTKHPIARRFLPLALAALIAACVMSERNLGETAGTSVGTGNPGKAAIAFKRNGQPFTFTGNLDIYGRKQIPVPGTQPQPLLSLSLDTAKYYELPFARIDSIPDSLWPSHAKIGDSIRVFNILAAGRGFGGILEELHYDRNRKVFLNPDSSTGKLEETSGEYQALEITELKPITAVINPMRLNPENRNFIFVFGTGYYAEADSGRFAFPPMPQRAYTDIGFVSFEFFGRPTSPTDSANVYSIREDLEQSRVDSIQIESLLERIPIPEMYR